MWAKPTVLGRWAVAHDADGWATYDWDVDEALLRVTKDGTVTGQANKLHDAAMKRVARDLDGTATYYVFDGEKIARVEQPEAGTRDFYVQEGQSIYSPLVSVHDQAADAHYWYLFDALGSTMGLVDENGNLSGKLQYDAFGNVLAEENVPRSAFFKYGGAYQYMPEDFEDMMLLWHRWYDPTVGRFVGRDPKRRWSMLQAPLPSYVFARGNPAGFVDATGAVAVAAIWQAFLQWVKRYGLASGVAIGAIWEIYLHYFLHRCEKAADADRAAFEKAAEAAWKHARGPDGDVPECYDACEEIFVKGLGLAKCYAGCDQGGKYPTGKT